MRLNFGAMFRSPQFLSLLLIGLSPLLLYQKMLSQNPGSPTESSQKSEKAAGSANQDLRGNFFARFYRAYLQQLRGNNESGPELPTRIPPPPLNSPPFPNAYWSYGGSSVIGTTNTTDYPLMRALYSGTNGEGWRKSKVQIYGWINGGFNLSTSSQSNLPEGYIIIPNRLELDQFVTYIERVPDTVQTDHVDWGFRLGNMFGIDYHFTTAKGWFSQQLLAEHRLYGDDPMMVYADVYFPQVADGMNIRVGRYISVPDIEAQLATNNYMYSHSMLFSYDPFTQTGIISTIKLNNEWLFNVGISAGNDIAPWASGAKPSLTACVNYTFNEGNDALYPCASGINDGKYAYNNVQLFVTTWYHKFNKSWHMATEAYYEYERDVPAINGPIQPSVGANPAYCDPGQVRCFAPEWAVVNYLQREMSPHDYISIRNDVLDDLKGQRTGYKTLYSEHSIAWGHWISDLITIRPELRFDRAYDMPAFNFGTKQNQFTFAVDIIVRY